MKPKLMSFVKAVLIALHLKNSIAADVRHGIANDIAPRRDGGTDANPSLHQHAERSLLIQHPLDRQADVWGHINDFEQFKQSRVFSTR